MQEDVGLPLATDGELRRSSWHMDFIYQLDGITREAGEIAVKFYNENGEIEFTPAALHINGKLGVSKTIFGDDFSFLQQTVATSVPKPRSLAEHGPLPQRQGGDRPDGLSRPRLVLGRPDSRAGGGGAPIGELGCTYVQFDDMSLAYMNDPHHGTTSRPSAAIRSASTSSTSTTSTKRSPARRHGGDDPPVPRELPLVLGRIRKLRLRGGSVVQRAGGRRVLHGVGRRAPGSFEPLRSCRRASRSCSAS